jgi:hypothetical protein
LALESPNNISILYSKNLSKTRSIETVLPIINFILCWGLRVQNNDMTPAIS